MRFILCGLTFLFATGVSSDSAPSLNDLLDERLEFNHKYKKEFVAEARESKLAKKLVPCEQGVADAWIELLEYTKKSDDEKLKKIVLRMEYFTELRTYLFDLEFAETADEKDEAVVGIREYQKKIEVIH